MKNIILTFGTFDVLHPGHIALLKYAKTLDKKCKLIVVIARDKNVALTKKQYPFFTEQERKNQLLAIRHVDKVLLGNSDMKKSFEIIKKLEPRFIVLGKDQEQKLEPLCKYCHNNGLSCNFHVFEKIEKNRYSSLVIKQSR